MFAQVHMILHFKLWDSASVHSKRIYVRESASIHGLKDTHWYTSLHTHVTLQFGWLGVDICTSLKHMAQPERPSHAENVIREHMQQKEWHTVEKAAYHKSGGYGHDASVSLHRTYARSRPCHPSPVSITTHVINKIALEKTTKLLLYYEQFHRRTANIHQTWMAVIFSDLKVVDNEKSIAVDEG